MLENLHIPQRRFRSYSWKRDNEDNCNILQWCRWTGAVDGSGAFGAEGVGEALLHVNARKEAVPHGWTCDTFREFAWAWASGFSGQIPSWFHGTDPAGMELRFVWSYWEEILGRGPSFSSAWFWSARRWQWLQGPTPRSRKSLLWLSYLISRSRFPKRLLPLGVLCPTRKSLTTPMSRSSIWTMTEHRIVRGPMDSRRRNVSRCFERQFQPSLSHICSYST